MQPLQLVLLIAITGANVHELLSQQLLLLLLLLQFGLNRFSGLTTEEFLQQYTGETGVVLQV